MQLVKTYSDTRYRENSYVYSLTLAHTRTGSTCALARYRVHRCKNVGWWNERIDVRSRRRPTELIGCSSERELEGDGACPIPATPSPPSHSLAHAEEGKMVARKQATRVGRLGSDKERSLKEKRENEEDRECRRGVVQKVRCGRRRWSEDRPREPVAQASDRFILLRAGYFALLCGSMLPPSLDFARILSSSHFHPSSKLGHRLDVLNEKRVCL